MLAANKHLTSRVGVERSVELPALRVLSRPAPFFFLLLCGMQLTSISDAKKWATSYVPHIRHFAPSRVLRHSETAGVDDAKPNF